MNPLEGKMVYPRDKDFRSMVGITTGQTHMDQHGNLYIVYVTPQGIVKMADADDFAVTM